MATRKPYRNPEITADIVAEAASPFGMRTYISLFSSAGIGCYGFKQEGFYCIATAELLDKRLKIQKFNHKCSYDTGYICGDMTQQETKDLIFKELNFWKRSFGIDGLDVLIATPPCQGMSVANHKKKDELQRNSLVVESIKMTKEILPKVFIFENVRAFLNSICTDIDGSDRTIGEAIDLNLGGQYNILSRVINFKDYGSPSSRTRTLVIGVRKDLKDITPFDIFPTKQPEQTLRETIGDLPSLKVMGDISETDIYHNFRKYAPHMEAWISEIKEGQSAFDNTDITRIPHTVKDGVVVYNAQKNGDKYTRQCWDKVAPCIHTRNDIMASQNTVHPCDNRVFSIREVMRMMSVPESFQWSDIPFDELNSLPLKSKQEFLKKEEMNIRQNLGEAVPTIIFRQIASKIKCRFSRPEKKEADVISIVQALSLTDTERLIKYISSSKLDFVSLSKIAELANAERDRNAAYYTRQDICFSIVKNLPSFKGKQCIKILEPSIGVGNFLPVLIAYYSECPKVDIDVVDIDGNSLRVLKSLLEKISIPDNIHINLIEADFLTFNFENHYDLVIGNPPYKKLTKEKDLVKQYKVGVKNTATNNIFSFFIEKALKLGDVVSLIVPKSLINAPEFNLTRSLMNGFSIRSILDFGEKAFKDVKIETISFIIDTTSKVTNTRIESYITNTIRNVPQSYITDGNYPYWLIYRDEQFDSTASKMEFGIFKAYRDRVITKSCTSSKGRYRVLKSRNIGNNCIVDIPDYDTYIEDISSYDVSKFLNTRSVLVPNLTYNPRACFLPSNCIADGSVAILTPKDPNIAITESDLDFYATEQFSAFYSVARNKGSRSLNIDNNSVFFFGKQKNDEA